YYDRSSIAVSQAIDIADKEIRRLFIEMLIGCHRLSLRQHGILHDILEDPYIIKTYGMMKERNSVNLFNGLRMNLKQADDTDIVLTLGDIIHRQRGVGGRNTYIILASSPTWLNRELAVKISWAGAYRASEKTLMDAVRAKAEEMAGEGNTHWVLDHLPEILHSQDFPFDQDDCPQKRLMELSIEAEYADDKTFMYEERLLRITVSERLFPITDLANVQDIAQVFLDILQCHKWLYDHPRILHRDISMSNVMYRKRGGEICGVLNDFDLSSFLPLVEASSLHRTGTPPYMAHDLLKESDIGHLYRHDLEALFYVSLILCCRYRIVETSNGRQLQELPLTDIPFADWYKRTLSWQLLSSQKKDWLTDKKSLIPLSPSFSTFRPWLDNIRRGFNNGLLARSLYKSQQDPEPQVAPIDARFLPAAEKTMLRTQPVPIGDVQSFDEDTLGGYVCYSQFLQTMWFFDGRPMNIKYEQ
ncbi:hypothetical protein IW261DRAFT_1349814, partial [Armillaria novae-zelandiae]